MTFSIDAAIEALKVLDTMSFPGHSGIFAFQRDGQLYLVGRKAVAVVDSWVPCSYSNMIYQDETLDSYISNPYREKSSIVDKSGKVKEPEKKFFALISRDPHGREDTLDELLKIRERVNKDFPDDGQIRMVSHGERYHSHKYGYAADGVDVSVRDARVMIRDEYFDLIKMDELRARKKLDEERRGYNNSLLPGVAVITHHALVSFPFPINLRHDRFERDYENDSPVIDENMMHFNRKVSPTSESPYTFNVALLGEALKFSSQEDFSTKYNAVAKDLEKLGKCYVPLVKAIVDEANSLHNAKHAEEIARWNSLTHRDSQSA